MALNLPAVPIAAPNPARVPLAFDPNDPTVDVSDPLPDLLIDTLGFAEDLRVVVAAIRAGLLQLESVVGAVGSGDLSAINAQLASLQDQVSDKASVASVSALNQSVAQVISGLSDYARVGQIPTTPGEVGADPAGSSAAVRALLTGGTYATTTNLSDVAAGKINVSTYNTKMTALDAADTANATAITAKYTKPSTGIPEADLAQAVRDKLAAIGSGGSGGADLSDYVKGEIVGDELLLTVGGTTHTLTDTTDGIPAGGTTGQILAKSGPGDYNTGFSDVEALLPTRLTPTAMAANFAPLVSGKVPSSYLPAGSGGSGGGVSLPWTTLTPSGDTTGATDTANIANALSSGTTVVLTGDFITKSPIDMPSFRTLILWDASVTLAPFSNCNVLRNSQLNATGNKHIRVQGIGKARLVGQVGAEIVTDAPAGATTVQVADPLPAGVYRIGATSASATAYETVTVTNGNTTGASAAPYTLTLSAGLNTARETGRKVYNQARLSNISGQVCILLVNAEDVTIENVSVGPSNAFACLQQASRRITWRNIHLNQNHSATNQDGIDIGAGCEDILIDGVTGTTGDDFCSIYAQNTSGSLHAYVKTLSVEQRNINRITVRNVQVDVGINIFRIQAGDGSKFKGLRARGITNTHVGPSTTGSAIGLVQLGQTQYVDASPAVGDLSDIVVDGFYGTAAYLVAADSTFSGVTIRNAKVTSPVSGLLRFTGAQLGNGFRPSGEDAVFENIEVPSVAVMAGLASAAGYTVGSGQTLNGLTLRGIKAGTSGSILHNEATCTNVVVSDIRVGTMTAAVVRSPIAETGTMSDVSVLSWGTTQRWTGAPTKLQLSGIMPEVTADAIAPYPTRGSQVTVAPGLDLTGGTSPDGGYYIGDGAAWRLITSLPSPVYTTPAQVTGLTAGNPSDTTVPLTWTATTGAASYKVERKLTSGTTWTTIGTPTATALTATGLTASTGYDFRVSAVNSAGTGPVSPIAQVTTLASNVPTPSKAGITATGGSGKNTIAGSAVNAVTYTIYRSTTSGTSGSKATIATGVVLPWDDTAVTPGTTYYYQARGYNTAGVGSVDASDEVSAVPTPGADATPPTAPTSLTATPANGQVALTWTASTDNVGVTGYRVYQDGALIQTVSTTSYTVSGLVNGTAYSFAVSAIDAAGNASSQTTPVSATPVLTAPGVTTITATGGSQKITINGSAPGADRYIVYRATTSGTSGSKSTIATDVVFPWGDTSVTPGTTYYYQARGKNDAGSSTNASAEVSAAATAPDTTAPTTPATPTATAGTNKATVTTTGATDDVGVTGYRWYRGGSLVGSTTSGTFTETGLPAGTPVSYTVAARDAAGNQSAQSAASNSVTPTAATTTTFVEDSFTDPDGTLLTSHVGEKGATWTQRNGSANLTLAAGKAYTTSSSGVTLSASGTPASADYTTAADFLFRSVSTVINAGVVARMTTSGSGYALRYIAASATWRLDRLTDGSSASIGSVAASGITAGTTKRVAIRVAGTTITGVVDGVDVVTATDATYAAAGLSGLIANGASTTTTGIHIDNFTGAASF